MPGANISVWMITGIAVIVLGFAALVVLSVRRSGGIKRSFFASPYTLWMILFTLVPVVLITYYALTDASGAFTLDNFKNFWDSNYSVNKLYAEMGPEYAVLITRGSVNIGILVYSLWMALICTLICLALGYPAAYFMADKNMKYGAILVVLFIIPMWMNFLLRTIAWMSILEDSGLINTVLKWLGLPKAQLMYNNTAVLLGMVYNFLPFMVFPIYTSLTKMDSRLLEAAQDLGANPTRTFWTVTVPLSIPGVVSGITMVFMPSVTTFFIPRILGGGNTMMFGDLIENRFLFQGNWNLGSALSLVMMALILVSLGILRRADPEGEGSGIV